MLTEIEKGILALFDEKLVQPGRKLSVGNTAKHFKLPDVQVGVQSGSGEKTTQTVYTVKAKVFIRLTFESLRDEAARRHGAYPIVLAIISYLIDQNLGLEISRLKFVQFQNTTTQEDNDAGLADFIMEFYTSFTLRKLPDEDAGDLLLLGLTYLLRPGDEVPDLVGEVSLAAES